MLGTLDSSDVLPPSVTKICLIKQDQTNEPIRREPHLEQAGFKRK